MRRVVSFATIAVVVIILLSGIDGLDFDPSPAAFLSLDDPELVAFNRIAKEFGDTGTIMIILDSSQTPLEKLLDIAREVNKLNWVNTVASVLDATKLGRINLLTLQIPVENYVSQSDGRLVLNSEILSDPMYSNLLISSSGKYYGVMVTIAEGSELRSNTLIPQLREAINASGVSSYRLIGESVANSTTFRSIMDLTFVYPPFIFLAIFSVYLIKFRRVSLALLTLVPPAGAAIAIVGIMGLLNTDINSLTVMIPSFIIIIGSAYGMHFLARFQENNSLEKAVERTIHEERVPILFSALTTMAGFSSYILLDMKAFQDMGLLVCAGIFLSATFTLVVLPGLVVPARTVRSGIRVPTKIPRLVSKAIVWTVLAISIISPILIMTIPLSIDQYAFFKDNSEIRQNAKIMNEAFGWLTNYSLMITPKSGGRIVLTGDQANQLTGFQEDLKELEGVSKVMSLVDVSRSTNIPLPLLMNALRSSDILGSASSLLLTEKALRINVFSPRSDSLNAERLKESIEKLIKEREVLTRDFDFTIAGTTLIWNSVNSSVVTNQIQSLIVSFGLILMLLFIIFKSVRSTLIATIPIALTTLFNFVFMAIFRVSLSISTALISGMLMGLVIDYAIHFTIWLRRLNDPEKAYRQTAVAIFTNGLSLIAGFSVLLLTPLLLYVDVAKLMVSGLAVGMIFTLILLPEIASRRFAKRDKKRT